LKIIFAANILCEWISEKCWRNAKVCILKTPMIPYSYPIMRIRLSADKHNEQTAPYYDFVSMHLGGCYWFSYTKTDPLDIPTIKYLRDMEMHLNIANMFSTSASHSSLLNLCHLDEKDTSIWLILPIAHQSDNFWEENIYFKGFSFIW
jgi:hypothetical protein